ncbi:hypothetical protein M407DRAFT_28665, partial [Tulasnella calospora MUT 4182]
MILGKMKETAEAYLCQKVADGNATVPAYVKDARCPSTKDSGTITGFTIFPIVNEPTAAAIPFSLQKRKNPSGSDESRITVYDLGGGILMSFSSAHQDDRHPLDDCRTLGKLKRVSKAKFTISSQMFPKLEIKPFEGGNDFSKTLTHAKFKELNKDFFRKTLKLVEQVSKGAEDIDDVVTVGGSTHRFRLTPSEFNTLM